MNAPKGSRVIITNREGKYLIQFRDGKPENRFPLMWEFFGGSSEGDEIPLAATVRELEEELGIKVQPTELQEIAIHQMDGVAEYLYRLVRPLEWNDFAVYEGAGAAFLTKEELLQLRMTKGAEFLARKYLR